MKNLNPRGALPPYRDWRIGKTLATIVFVNTAEAFLLTCYDPDVSMRLQLEIDRIKLGEVSLREFRSVEEFLNGAQA